MKKIIPYVAAMYATLLMSCSEGPNYRGRTVRGEVLKDYLWEQPGFGYLYRVEVKHTKYGQTEVTPFVFVGSESELRDLDQKINPGTNVEVKDNLTAFSFSLEKVLTPDKIKIK